MKARSRPLFGMGPAGEARRWSFRRRFQSAKQSEEGLRRGEGDRIGQRGRNGRALQRNCDSSEN